MKNNETNMNKSLFAKIKTAVKQLIPDFLLIKYRENCEFKRINQRLAVWEHENPGKAKEFAGEIAGFRKNIYPYMIPYPFVKYYAKLRNTIKVYRDGNDLSAFPYVLHNGKRLYFRNEIPDYYIKRSYAAMLTEQDYRSPHRYLSRQMEDCEYGAVLELGAAEGMFTLDMIEKAAKCVLVECDPQWVEALELTFAPYKDKVTIVKKMITDFDSATTVTIDTLIHEFELHDVLLKMDIEGFESKALKGLNNCVHAVKCAAVCIYHKPDDELIIPAFFRDNGFECEFSDGVIFRYFDQFPPMGFPKGVVRAHR